MFNILIAPFHVQNGGITKVLRLLTFVTINSCKHGIINVQL